MLSDNDRQKINEIYISFSNFHERLVLEEEWEGKDLMEEIMKKNVTLNDLSYTFQAEQSEKSLTRTNSKKVNNWWEDYNPTMDYYILFQIFFYLSLVFDFVIGKTNHKQKTDTIFLYGKKQ